MIKQTNINRVHFLEFLHIMDVGLRSGYNITQSLEIFVKDTDNTLTVEVRKVLDELASGKPLPGVMDEWLLRQPNRDLAIFVATVHTQLEVGGNLANKLLFLAQMLPHLQEI